MTVEAPPVISALPARGEPQLRIVKPRPNEPQFDDERPEAAGYGDCDLPRQTAGALALALDVAPRLDCAVPRLRLVADGIPSDVALPPAVTPPAKAWVGRLVQAINEVLAGERPLAQLAAHLAPPVYAGLDASLGRPLARPEGRHTATPTLRSLRLCEPAPGVAEVAAVVRRGERSAAMALRLEHRAAAWRCVALHVG